MVWYLIIGDEHFFKNTPWNNPWNTARGTFVEQFLCGTIRGTLSVEHLWNNSYVEHKIVPRAIWNIRGTIPMWNTKSFHKLYGTIVDSHYTFAMIITSNQTAR